MQANTKLGKFRAEDGAALAVSLILLLVMTIVGVAAMNGARLEINMAGRMQDEQVALRRSERTLLAAEDQVTEMENVAGKFSFINEPDEEDGLYDKSEAIDEKEVGEMVANRDWSDMVAVVHNDNGDEDKDQIVIEYLGPEVIPGGDVSIDGERVVAGEIAHVYRINTRSETGAASMRLIESFYTTLQGP